MDATDLEMLGYCGIYCRKCDIHVACKKGDTARQQAIADWINEHHGAECTAEEIRCSGCKGPLDEHWSVSCKVRVCASGRGVKTCADCEEYPDCETLETFYSGGDYESARLTLKRISEIGIDKWAEEQGE